MFFLEKIINSLRKDKFNEVLENYDKKISQNPLSQIPVEDALDFESENCEHVFMPIDSTGEILACSKCGLVKKKSELHPVNFFINNDNVKFS